MLVMGWLEKWFACLHSDIKPRMAVWADVYDIIADAVSRTQKRGMKGIGVTADRAGAEFIPCLNPAYVLAVHTPALVDAGKNGYGAVRQAVR